MTKNDDTLASDKKTRASRFIDQSTALKRFSAKKLVPEKKSFFVLHLSFDPLNNFTRPTLAPILSWLSVYARFPQAEENLVQTMK